MAAQDRCPEMEITGAENAVISSSGLERSREVKTDCLSFLLSGDEGSLRGKSEPPCLQLLSFQAGEGQGGCLQVMGLKAVRSFLLPQDSMP